MTVADRVVLLTPTADRLHLLGDRLRCECRAAAARAETQAVKR